MSKQGIQKWKLSLFFIFSLPGLAFSSWISRTPEVRETLKASTSVMGLIIFGLACGSLIGLLSASRIISRKGTRFAALISVLIVIIGIFVISAGVFAAFKSIVFAGLIIFGLGYGLAEVVLNVDGSALERAAGKTMMPALHASFSAGTLIGAGLSSLAILFKVPVLVHLLLIAGIEFILIFTFFRFLPEDTGKEDAVSRRQEVSSEKPENVWTEPRTLLIGLIVLGMAFAEGSANDWLPLTMTDGFHVTHAQGTAVYGVFLTAMLIARIFGGAFLDRYGRVPVLRLCTAVSVIGLSLVIFSGNLTAAVIGVFLWGIGASLGFPVGLSAAGDDPKGAVKRVGAISFVGYCAFLVGPPVLGLLGEEFGLVKALIIVLIGIVLSGLVSRAAKPPAHQKNVHDTNSRSK
ncbi:MFS transporter [Bacillus velezensis]|uniref:MFS transporter n=1 Tax=Bacillus velezensis TaxID=492670 RepID=UPI003D215076